MRASSILTEAYLLEDPIYRSFRNVGRIIVEKKMTEKEIMDLFSAVEQGVTAGGNNRTLLGKGKDVVTDVASAINKAYQGVADKISKSGPVSGFDSMVDKLTDKLADAAGGQEGAVMTAIKKYREFAKKHPIMQGAIYAILIALTGISGAGLGGAAILGGIKMADKLLLGNKASSALWSGFLTGATAYGIGQLKGALAGGDAGGAPDTAPAPDMDAETAARNAAYAKAYGIDGADTLDQMNAAIMKTAEPGTIPADYSQLGAGAATDYTVQSGDTLSQIAQTNNVSVQDLMQANPDITNPDVLKAGQSISIPSETGSAVYQGGVGTNADTMAKIASGEYTDSAISQNMAKAAAGATDTGTSAGTSLTDLGAEAGKGGAKAAVTGAETPPEIGQAFDAGIAPIGPDGTPMKAVPFDEPAGEIGQALNPNAAPLDAAGNAMKQVSFIDLTNGNSGTMNLPDGSSVPVTVFPEGGIQPRLPGGERIVADLNGNKVTAIVFNGKAYVPNFKMESVVIKKLPISETIDKRLTVRMWMLNESLGRKRSRYVEMTPKGILLTFENIERYQRVLRALLREAPGDAGPGRADIPGELRPDMPQSKDSQSFFGRAMSGLRNLGHQFTTKITADKLKMNWHVKGKPTESDELYQFLTGEGVPAQVVDDVWKQMGIPLPAGDDAAKDTAPTEPTPTEPTPTEPTPTEPTPTEPTPAPAPTPAPTEPTPGGGSSIFADPAKLAASFKAFQDADGKLPPQFRGVLKDILLTALRTVESRQRKMNQIVKEAKKIQKQIIKIKEQRRL